MDIPRDNHRFMEWAKTLGTDDLIELEIELSRRVTSLELQLDDRAYSGHTDEWRHKANVALKFDRWRLESTQRLYKMRQSFDSRFVQTARGLLDPDTFGVIAAQAASTSASSSNGQH